MAFWYEEPRFSRIFQKRGFHQNYLNSSPKKLTPSINAPSNTQNSFSHVNHLKYELVSFNLLTKSFSKKGVLGNLNVIYSPTYQCAFTEFSKRSFLSHAVVELFSSFLMSSQYCWEKDAQCTEVMHCPAINQIWKCRKSGFLVKKK